jgi:hypothetical protein
VYINVTNLLLFFLNISGEKQAAAPPVFPKQNAALARVRTQPAKVEFFSQNSK